MLSSITIQPATYLRAIILTCLLGCSISLSAQYQQISIGAGLSPLHQSKQNDFAPTQMPYDIFLHYQRGNMGVRVDYNWNPLYVKENFSFTHRQYELSLTYSFRELLRLRKFNPYVRAGVTKWQTEFTTEGYPGIVDYDFKIEQDKGYGMTGAVGVNYPYRQFAFGIEGQFSVNGNSQFIAGGFDPQPLSSDHYRMMVYVQYRLPITISPKHGIAVTCPTF